MRFAGDLGHLEGTLRPMPGVTVKASSGDAVFTGADRAGKPWTLRMGATGGVGWTSVFSGDFDADGQMDLLIGAHFPGNGSCIDGTSVTLLLFDERGRPVPWAFETDMPRERNDSFPFVPVLAVDANRDKRAEFVLTECSRERGSTITNVYEARDGRLHVADSSLTAAYRKAAGGLPTRKWTPHWFDPKGEATERIDALHGDEFGCEAMQPPPKPLPELKPGQGYAVALTQGPCAKDQKAETVFASGRKVLGFPEALILESAEKGREIDLRMGLHETMRVMRYGYRVRPLGEGWYWVDLDAATSLGRVEIYIEAFQTRRIEVPHIFHPNGCIDLLYDERHHPMITVRRCGNKTWQRVQGGSEETLEGSMAKGGHTAMQHTVPWETRYERPPGSGRILARADVSMGSLTRWTGASSHALHDSQGGLVASPVKTPFDADLLFGADALVFAPRGSAKIGEAIEVRGHMRWRVSR